MIKDDTIQCRFNPDDWKDRITELKELKTTGVCFYTDGGQRTVSFRSCAGYGIHAYFYNEDKPEGLGGFKLDYPTRHGYVEKKKVAKGEAVNVCKFLNAYGNIDGATSQVAELEAFIQAASIFVENHMHEFCNKFTLWTDSEHVTQGINEYMATWISKGWRKSDGRQVKNLAHWKKIDELITRLKTLGVELDIKWLKGHAFDTGNNISDQMATLGLYQKSPYGDEWIDRNDFNAASVDFCPLLIDSKLLYYPGRNIRSKFDGKYHHFIYSNNCPQDDINEVGRNLIDASIAIVMTDSDQAGINALYDSCRSLDKAINSTPKVVDLNVATKPKAQIEIDDSVISYLPREVDKKDIKIKTTSDKVAIVVLDPPRNSLDTQRTIERLLSVYRLYEGGQEKDFLEVDITDQLFDKEVNGKGVTKYKFKVNEAFHIDVDLPIWKESGVKTLKTALTFGLDLPRRRVYSNIKHLNPQVKAFTWYENEQLSYFATIVIVDGAIGVWCAEHTNTINTEELADEFYSS